MAWYRLSESLTDLSNTVAGPETLLQIIRCCIQLTMKAVLINPGFHYSQLIKCVQFNYHGIQCQVFTFLYAVKANRIPPWQDTYNNRPYRSSQSKKMPSCQLWTTQNGNISFCSWIRPLQVAHTQQRLHHLQIFSSHFHTTGCQNNVMASLPYSYLFQRFQPCLPPSCSLLCLQRPLFRWWQLLVIIVISQEPLHKEIQSWSHTT